MRPSIFSARMSVGDVSPLEQLKQENAELRRLNELLQDRLEVQSSLLMTHFEGKHNLAPMPDVQRRESPMSVRRNVRSVKDGTFLGTIVVDTREQKPYEFTGFLCDAQDGGGPMSIPTVRGTLASGDYSLAGFETQVAVERKSLPDLYSTLGQDRERFEREIQRLNGYAFAAVVIEADWDQIRFEPPLRTQLEPKTVYRTVLSWQQRYRGVHWWAVRCREAAEATTFRILERFWKNAQG